MKSWVRNTLRAGVLAAGFLLFAASPAHAGDQFSKGNSGLLTGNNVSVPIAVAAPVCGNGGGGAGGGAGISKGCYADASNDDSGTQVSDGNSGAGTGNNVSVPIAVAAPICGNGVGIFGGGLGISDTCVATASNNEGAGMGGQLTKDNSGLITGNNWSSPIAVAVPVCGNGGGGAGGGVGISKLCVADAHNGTAGEVQLTKDNSGAGVGNNISIPSSWSVPVCGNGVGIFGFGLGISDTCVASSSNGEDGYAMKSGKKAANKVTETTTRATEALPIAAPLPAPAPEVQLPSPAGELLGGVAAPDVSNPTQNNSVSLPLS